MTTAQLNLPNFSAIDIDQLSAQIESLIAQSLQALTQFDSLIDTSIDDIDAPTALARIDTFDQQQQQLERQWGILSHLNSVASTDDVRAAHHHLLAPLSDLSTQIGQHVGLFKCYQAIEADASLSQTLSPAKRRAIALSVKHFQLSGVDLPQDIKSDYARIKSQFSQLSAQFSDNVLDATQSYQRVLTQSELTGLPESSLKLLAQMGQQYLNSLTEAQQQVVLDEVNTEQLYVATLDIPVYLAIMTYADTRALREDLHQAYVTRASDQQAYGDNPSQMDNSPIMSEIVTLRQQLAQMLGFDNYAQLSLATKMADTPEQINQFLHQLADSALPAAKQNLEQLQSAATEYGLNQVQPWDKAWLAEKVKQDQFNLSQEQTRPYFPLPKVIDGLFAIVARLYGIRIEAIDAEAWCDDVQYYQVYEQDELIGGFYFDLYARSGKRGGAWMNGFQSRQVTTDQTILPVCFMCANFTPPVGDTPSLLTHNEVTTLFHEFGHGLHHLLTKVEVADVAGVAGVEWDAVELPSQFMEFWAWEPEGIVLISEHVETGESLPQSLLDAMLAARHFQSGMMTLRQIEFALFDLNLHEAIPALDHTEMLRLLTNIRQDYGLLPSPSYDRFANGFSHIFAGGYAAGYYSYKWAELLASDAFDRFESEGIFNTQAGKDFYQEILARGGSRPAADNFAAFRGRAPNITALLRHSGFDAQDGTSHRDSKAATGLV